ncbi:glycoside hydrolase family 3 protein [Microbacterium sediminis]|nr:glycoside hydrolase family 3 protein [Microbacterium sediminis]
MGVGGRGRRALALCLPLAVLAATASGALPATAADAPPAHAAAPAAAPAAPEDEAVTVVAAEPDTIAARAQALAAEMDSRALAGTIVMGHYGTQNPATAVRYLAEARVGGFLLMGSNVPYDEERLRELTTALRGDPALPALVGVDEEGGTVTRLPWDDFAAGGDLAAADPGEAEIAFAARGALVARAGIGVNYGVVADATDDPYSFIAPRVLGTDPQAAAERVTAATEGEAPYALTTLKHFPGHGTVADDSHWGIPVADQSYDDWLATTAVPFQAGIDAGAPLVMMGHLAYPQISDQPASLAPEWYRILREDLGFTGVTVTDDLGMLLSSGDERYTDPVSNAVAAVAAGADLVLQVVRSDWTTAGDLADGIAAAADAGLIPEARLRQAAERVLALRLQLSGQSVAVPVG